MNQLTGSQRLSLATDLDIMIAQIQNIDLFQCSFPVEATVKNQVFGFPAKHLKQTREKTAWVSFPNHRVEMNFFRLVKHFVVINRFGFRLLPLAAP